MKKYAVRSKWAKIRSLNFKIGLMLSLAFVFFAFQIDIADTPRIIDYGETIEFTGLDNSTSNHITKVYIPPVKPKAKEYKKEILDVFKIETVDELIVEDDTPFESEEDIVDFSPVDEGTENISASKVDPFLGTPEESGPHFFVSQMPRFGNCDETLLESEIRECSNKQLLEYIYKHLQYPSVARQLSLEGSVIAQFTISKNGKITDIEVIRDIGGGTKEEVYRVIENMPIWTPGKQNFRPVNVRITLPVKFSLL